MQDKFFRRHLFHKGFHLINGPARLHSERQFLSENKLFYARKKKTAKITENYNI